MKESTKKKKITATEVAYCGMAAALSVTILLLSGAVPVLTYAAPLFVSAGLSVVDRKFGKRMAVLTYVSVSLLVLILGADKEAAFFYLFFGHYPLVKEYFDRIPVKAFRALAKVLLFALLTALMYYLLIRVMGLSEIASEKFWMDLLFYVLLTGVMMMYDGMLSRIRYLKLPNVRIGGK